VVVLVTGFVSVVSVLVRWLSCACSRPSRARANEENGAPRRCGGSRREFSSLNGWLTIWVQTLKIGGLTSSPDYCLISDASENLEESSLSAPMFAARIDGSRRLTSSG